MPSDEVPWAHCIHEHLLRRWRWRPARMGRLGGGRRQPAPPARRTDGGCTRRDRDHRICRQTRHTGSAQGLGLSACGGRHVRPQQCARPRTGAVTARPGPGALSDGHIRIFPPAIFRFARHAQRAVDRGAASRWCRDLASRWLPRGGGRGSWRRRPPGRASAVARRPKTGKVRRPSARHLPQLSCLIVSAGLSSWMSSCRVEPPHSKYESHWP